MIQPNEQRLNACTDNLTKDTPLLRKSSSNKSLAERIKNVMMKKEAFSEKKSLLKNDYGTF